MNEEENQMFARILVPTDFGAQSEVALAYGRALANQFGAALHLIHVSPNPFLHAVAANRRSIEEAPAGWLQDRLTDDDRRRGAVAVVEQSDEPANEILQYAKSADIELIIIGTHGRKGLARVVLGSVAEAVVRAAPCPVLTVHADGSAAVVSRSLGLRS
jgi:nucleotide-binding universal stress UspA family protein